MPQVRIELNEELYAVLERYAEAKCRHPTGQATWIVRQALRERRRVEGTLQHLEPGLGSEPGPAIIPPVTTVTAAVPDLDPEPF